MLIIDFYTFGTQYKLINLMSVNSEIQIIQTAGSVLPNVRISIRCQTFSNVDATVLAPVNLEWFPSEAVCMTGMAGDRQNSPTQNLSSMLQTCAQWQA